MTLGEQIRARRKELGWSLRELGQRAHLTASFLCDVEKGRRRIGADSLLHLSQALSIPMDQLVGRYGEQATSGPPLSLPASLICVATQANIPFRGVLCLYWLQRTLNDHRAPSKRTDPEAFDWLKLWEAVRVFLE